MKNFDLEHFGVVEMNQQEMKQTDGGIIPVIVIGAMLLLGGCVTAREGGEAVRYQTERDTIGG